MPATDSKFPHLRFERVREGRPYFPPSPRDAPQRQQNVLNDKLGHAARLNTSMQNLRSNWQHIKDTRSAQGLPPLPNGQPMIVVVEDGIDFDFLRSAFNFEIIAEEADGFVLVLSEDANLQKFTDTINKFLASKHGGGSAAKLYELCESPETRLKRILSDELYKIWGQITDKQIIVVDVSISCVGTDKIPDLPPQGKDEADERYEKRKNNHIERHRAALEALEKLQRTRAIEYVNFIKNYNGEAIDIFDDASHGVFALPDCFTVRTRISGQCLRDLAENYPHLFEITEVEPNEAPFDIQTQGKSAGPQLIAPESTAPAVCVIDSGMQENHLYLQPAILSSEARCFMPEVAPNDTADYVKPSGHGTRVAGALLFCDSVPVDGEQKTLPFWLHNARVLDSNNQIPETLMPAIYLEHVINYYNDANRSKPARIFNHSINSRAPYRNVHMSTWGAAIDKMSYYKDILVIQSAGNIEPNSLNPLTLGIKQHLDAGKNYPDYLLESSCRIRNPGHSLNAITVGSISPSAWEDANYKGIAGDGRPSAFTPSGPGIWNTIKPDVVEIGGDFAKSNAAPVLIVTRPALSPLLPRSTIHSPGATAKDGVGTSFTAPKIAHIAARLANQFPDEPCLLYRALIANSARWPSWAENEDDKLSILRLLGYGIPDLERAIHNTEHRVTLISSNEQWIPAREAHVYHVPVPEQLRSPEEEKLIRVDVTLSYASMPRRTRRLHRGYLATWLDWQVSKQAESFESFCSRIFRDGNSAEQDGEDIFRWMLRERSDHGEIEGISRQNGTLQKDWCYLKSHELPPNFCIAVRGHPGWDPSPDSKAKYAMVVSFEAVNEDMLVYQHIRASIEAQATVQTRERVEIITDSKDIE